MGFPIPLHRRRLDRPPPEFDFAAVLDDPRAAPWCVWRSLSTRQLGACVASRRRRCGWRLRHRRNDPWYPEALLAAAGLLRPAV